MVFAEPLSPPDPPDPVFALLSLASFVFRPRPSTESLFFPNVFRISHRVLFVHSCLASAASSIRHSHAMNFVVDHPRACHSTLTRPHKGRTPLRSVYPFDKVRCFCNIRVGALRFGVLRNLRCCCFVPRNTLLARLARSATHIVRDSPFSLHGV